MAEAVSAEQKAEQKNEWLADEVSTAPNGTHAVEDNSTLLTSRALSIPLPKDAVSFSVSCIPADRNAEMLREMAEAASANDAEQARNILIRWVMIGSYYADPDRKQNHPLRKVFGVFQDEPLWDELMEKVRARRDSE